MAAKIDVTRAANNAVIKPVYRIRRELFWSLFTLLILVTVVGWSIYVSFGWQLYQGWDTKADSIAARLHRSLGDTQLQLGVLAESLGSQLADEGLPHGPMAGRTRLLERLRISELTLHTPRGPQSLFAASGPTMPGLWRASVYDFNRTQSPQSALEITEYGPRVLAIEPLKIGQELCGLEAAIDLQTFLHDFSRREGVELAFLAPASPGGKPNPTDQILQAELGRDYKILATSSPKAPEVLASLPLKKYIGQEARGIAQLSRTSAYAVLMLDDVEYRASTVASVSSGSTLVIWTDYTRPVGELTYQMRRTLWTTSLFVLVLGGLGLFLLARVRRRVQNRLLSYRDALRTANQSLRSEAQARQKIEERLRGIADEMYTTRQNDMKLLAHLAHQLKLNASATIGFAEIIREANPTLKDKESLEALRQMGERIFQMGENLDLWGRRDKVFDHTHVQAQGLKSVVAQAIDALAPMAERKDLVVRAQLEDNLTVNADLMLLLAVLKNLLSNAIKYSPHNGQIEITSRRFNQQVELSIADHGQGIPRLVMEKLFEPDIEKLHRGTDGEEGLGLGLLIVRWACRVHGVELRVTSDEGQGCRVTLIFPAPAAATPHKA